jgi:adenylate cyclase
VTEERRVVTVLFADVSGFTALSENLDPEDVRQVMNECFEALSAEIYKRGGTVDKYIGDNVMAVFGLPKAQEDDPLRAVEAAFGMQEKLRELSARNCERLGVTLSMRIGLNTGLVVAGEVGSKEKHAPTVMGDTVNLASRIEHHSTAGEVWVSRTTALAAGRGFHFEPMAPLEVKGKKKPQVFYRAIGRRCDLPDSPFAGRSKELAVLRAALEDSLAGRSRLVTVSGEAGIGKTRLLREFLKEAAPAFADRGGRLYSAAALPRESKPFALFASFAGELGFELPTEGDAHAPERFCSAERAIRKAAEKAPLALIWEDAHFADNGSIELLEFLIKSLRDIPVLMVCLFRPEAQSKILWCGCTDGHFPVELKPLAEDERRDLIDRFLGPNRLPAEIKERLSRHSGGNSFFLTELLRDLIEAQALHQGELGWEFKRETPWRTPESVQGTVLARLDRLSACERRALDAASCLGMELESGMLETVEPGASSCLPALAAKGFLEARPEGFYAFGHAIIQDVCYESLLKKRRHDYHVKIAEIWEERARGGGFTPLARAADHRYWARDAAKGLALNWQAALRAERCFCADQCLMLFERCRELFDLSPGEGEPTRAQILFKLGDIYSWVFEQDKALEFYQESLALMPPDHPWIVDGYRKASIIFNIRGEPDRAEEMLLKAAEALRGAREQKLGVYYEVATSFFRSGKNEQAKEWILKIMECFRETGRPLEVSEADDIHRLIPAFSHLVAG